jgi:hypothetical protein
LQVRGIPNGIDVVELDCLLVTQSALLLLLPPPLSIAH